MDCLALLLLEFLFHVFWISMTLLCLSFCNVMGEWENCRYGQLIQDNHITKIAEVNLHDLCQSQWHFWHAYFVLWPDLHCQGVPLIKTRYILPDDSVEDDCSAFFSISVIYLDSAVHEGTVFLQTVAHAEPPKLEFITFALGASSSDKILEGEIKLIDVLAVDVGVDFILICERKAFKWASVHCMKFM